MDERVKLERELRKRMSPLWEKLSSLRSAEIKRSTESTGTSGGR